MSKNKIQLLHLLRYKKEIREQQIKQTDKIREQIKEIRGVIFSDNSDASLLAKGGEIDLFEDYENMPKNLSVIVEKYAQMDEVGEMNYAQTKNFLNEVEAIGYTFDYGLDNQPYDLRKII